eukprot:scaffold72591_cov56-Phaeocystis_antarctica.AAC.3
MRPNRRQIRTVELHSSPKSRSSHLARQRPSNSPRSRSPNRQSSWQFGLSRPQPRLPYRSKLLPPSQRARGGQRAAEVIAATYGAERHREGGAQADRWPPKALERESNKGRAASQWASSISLREG